VYTVKRVDGGGKERVLHRNQLLPLNLLDEEDEKRNIEQAAEEQIKVREGQANSEPPERPTIPDVRTPDPTGERTNSQEEIEALQAAPGATINSNAGQARPGPEEVNDTREARRPSKVRERAGKESRKLPGVATPKGRKEAQRRQQPVTTVWTEPGDALELPQHTGQGAASLLSEQLELQ
jgi:hypothetical protein